MPPGRKVGRDQSDIVLDRDPAPFFPKKGQSPPIFGPCLLCFCAQTAGWMKMPLGMELGLDPSDTVFDGDPSPLPIKGTEPPIFSLRLLWPNGYMHGSYMDQDATWYGGRPRPMPHCVRLGPSSPPQKGAQPSIFDWMGQDATWYDGRPRPGQPLLC